MLPPQRSGSDLGVQPCCNVGGPSFHSRFGRGRQREKSCKLTSCMGDTDTGCLQGQERTKHVSTVWLQTRACMMTCVQDTSRPSGGAIALQACCGTLYMANGAQ
jgi:hypothetical protein